MNILGVDPGLVRLGIAAVRITDSGVELFKYGLIANPQQPGHTFNQRLNKAIEQISNDFPRLVGIVEPELIAAELVPPGRLGSNNELVTAAITTCKVIAFQFGIPWIGYGANTIKKALTGNGQATKPQVRRVVWELYPDVQERHKSVQKEQKANGEKAEGLPEDVTDAIATALTAAYKIKEGHDREDV